MMKNNFESIFENLNDSQFEDILKECGFKFKKVEGEGGLFIDGKRVYSHELKEEYIKEEYITVIGVKSKLYRKINSSIKSRVRKTLNKFELREEYELVA